MKAFFISLCFVSISYTAYSSTDTLNLLLYESQKINSSVLNIQSQSMNNAGRLDFLSIQVENLDSMLQTSLNVLIQNSQAITDLNGNSLANSQLISRLSTRLNRQLLINQILIGAGIILILTMFWYIITIKRQSIDYLLSQAESLGSQNQEILEKSESLRQIRKSLKEMIKSQKTNQRKKKRK